MSKREARRFLAQFPAARQRVKAWPKWMRDAAVTRGATFPKPPADGVPGTGGGQSNG